jgi:hypothetical protein
MWSTTTEAKQQQNKELKKKVFGAPPSKQTTGTQKSENIQSPCA